MSIENGLVTYDINTHTMNYVCDSGYRMKGQSKMICVNGTWNPSNPPTCLKETVGNSVFCSIDPEIRNGKMAYTPVRMKGTVAVVFCDAGFSTDDTFQPNFPIVCSSNGEWTMPNGNTRLSSCTKKYCPSPPDVPKALHRYTSYNPNMSDGLEVEYICSSGYVLLGPVSSARLICRNGQWEGPIPTCVQEEDCPSPGLIQHGKWELVNKGKQDLASYNMEEGSYPKYVIGAVVEYSCEPGYKLIGSGVLQCRPDKIWSKVPPICVLESDPTWYCPDFLPISNGVCKCMGQDSSDLTLCRPFYRGIRIECACAPGFKLQGVDVLTCIHSSASNNGRWDWEFPSCLSNSEIDLIPEVQNEGKSYSSGDISDSKNKESSLVIVVTTACSVLGVLLLIMVVVVIRRKKPGAPHLFQQGPAPTPYARVHNNSIDEHDRMALMAYADASGIHLPSYEESMRSSNGSGFSVVGCGVSPSTSEYRRLLPASHPGVRAAILHQQNVGGDGNNNINNNNNNNSNRLSVVTTSTMNRDGVSEMFGSMDTVNVSMSDASTSVTVETFDSGTSNRSISSRTARAGSLNSSNDQLSNVNDDAPLLETSSQREADVVSVSSNPSRSSKEEP
ncbi:CUB and sushi domain-containing protein 3 [Biomphalaria pfeifferi]|uniref:CUB and sushi domain-containing protein 3 n=1 Tax=Biomphalaria pfeifferi TaxID=112525 RepID=A0AAD8AVT5_BIOPF|nr:CUB and sushi domain-containing protein 3 [Biomphalaria pfeifferi]